MTEKGKTPQELRAEIAGVLKQANRRQLELVLRIVRSILL